MKLETAINNAYQNLKDRNIQSALLDSELLMAKVINQSREYIVLKKLVQKKSIYLKIWLTKDLKVNLWHIL